MEDPLEERTQKKPQHLLSNAIADSGDPQRSRLAVALGDMHAPQGVGSIRPVLEVAHQGQQVLQKVVLVELNADPVNPRRPAITSHVAEGFAHERLGNPPGQRVCLDLGHRQVSPAELQVTSNDRRRALTPWRMFLSTVAAPEGARTAVRRHGSTG